MQQRPLPATRDTQQPTFLRHFRKFLPFSSLTDAAPLVLNAQPRDPLDVCLCIFSLVQSTQW
jgi:hypothetical protein